MLVPVRCRDNTGTSEQRIHLRAGVGPGSIHVCTTGGTCSMGIHVSPNPLGSAQSKGTGQRGSWPVPSARLSSPHPSQHPTTPYTGPRSHPAPHHPLLRVHQRQSNTQMPLSILGAAVPISQTGKTAARGAPATCPNPCRIAACPLQAGAGHSPDCSPHHYLPSLPPSFPPSLPPSEKTFHKTTRDGGNSERPHTSGACPNHNTGAWARPAATPARSRRA